MPAVQPIKIYPGRKGAAGTVQNIISQIPACNLFIDAMCGSGKVGSEVKGCKVIFNDKSAAVIDKISFTADNIQFLKKDYRYLIDKYGYMGPGTVIYFDPPYLFETRSYKKPIYKFEWTDQDHKNFLKQVKKMNSCVMISHYPCKMYDQALKGWRKFVYKSMTHAGLRDECIYMNFQQPVLLQCYQVVGKNFTDRQRIKRKIDRLIVRLKLEAPHERAAILSGIIANFNYVGHNPNLDI